MRAQQPVGLAWETIPLRTQLDILIYETTQDGHWAIVERWAHKHATRPLLRALAERKRVWGKNRLPRATQEAYAETATYYVSNDRRVMGVRDYLLLMLYCG